MPSEVTTTIDSFVLGMGLLGGLALFLLGMEMLASALKAVAGERMKTVLATLTTNRFFAVLTGAFVTAVIQSSSVTTVLVVGFISAGLMSLAQSVGIIMGANIGTTITAQIIAFKITKYSLLLVAAGFAASFFSKRDDVKHYGNGVLGLGLVFLGMGVMGEAMAPLRTYGPFLDWMTRMESPFLGILAGTVFTALVQSSSATTGVVIVMASQGLISLPAGIALAFGANIGTCVTALLAAIGKTREAVRAAVVHVLFNVLGVLIWLAFIDQLADFVTALSPHASDALSATEHRAAETPRQIANAHTVFNVLNTFVFVWFVPQFARAAERMVPDRPLGDEERIRARYLDEALLLTPALALGGVRMELSRLGERVIAMLDAILPAMLQGSGVSLHAVRRMDDEIDALHGLVVTYLGRISRQPLSRAQTDELMRLMEATNSLENIGDIVETNLVELGLERIDEQVTISEETRDVIRRFHGKVTDGVRVSIEAVINNDGDAALQVVTMKPDVNEMAGSAAVHEAARLVAEEPKRLAAYRIEVDMLENLKRVYYFAKRMARAVAKSAADQGEA